MGAVAQGTIGGGSGNRETLSAKRCTQWNTTRECADVWPDIVNAYFKALSNPRPRK